jgi:formate dehydrogenase subunit delta
VTSGVSSEVRLAHEIARQFADEPPQEAAARVAAHIRMFWAPPMIGTLVAEADEGSARLDPVVARVAEMLR